MVMLWHQWVTLLNKVIAEAKTTPQLMDELFYSFLMFDQPKEKILCYFIDTYNTYHPQLDSKDKEKKKTAKMVTSHTTVVIKRWLKLDWMLLHDPILLSKLNSWVDESSGPSLRDTINETMKKMNERLTVLDRHRERKKTLVKLQTTDKKKPLRLESLKVEELAQQLTLWEHHAYSSIPYTDLIGEKWNKLTEGRFVQYFLFWFQKMVSWLAKEILEAGNEEARVKVLSHVINLGVKFKSLNNFNGVMEVLCCLRSPPIARLTRTWSLLSPGKLVRLNKLSEVMSSSKNFELYRKLVAEERSSHVPFIGVTTMDMIHLNRLVRSDSPVPNTTNNNSNNTANSNNNSSSNITTIVEQKMAQVAQVLSNYLKSQDMGYNFAVKRNYYDFFATGMEFTPIDNLLALSEKVEKIDLSLSPSLLSSSSSSSSSSGFCLDSYFSAPILWGTEPVLPTKYLSMTSRDWSILLMSADLVGYKDGETVLEQGVAPTKFCRIKRGTATVVMRGSGRPLCKTVGEGYLFGEFTLFDELYTSAAVIAEKELVVQELSLGLLIRLFENDALLARRLYISLATRLSAQLRALFHLAYCEANNNNNNNNNDNLNNNVTIARNNSDTENDVNNDENISNNNTITNIDTTVGDVEGIDMLRGEGGGGGRVVSEEMFDASLFCSVDFGEEGEGASLEYTRKFCLPEDEVLLKEYTCQKESKMAMISGGSMETEELFVSKRFICHQSKRFNLDNKEVIQISTVTSVTLKGPKLTICAGPHRHVFKFKDLECVEDAHSFITNLITHSFSSNILSPSTSVSSPFPLSPKEGGGGGLLSSGGGFGVVGATGAGGNYHLTLSRNFDPSQWIKTEREEALKKMFDLTKDDWSAIRLMGSPMTASPGQVLIEQNATRQKIIVIDKGCCRLQKKEKKSNKAVILTVLGKDEIAGEETFLGDDGACCSVIAATPLQYHVIDGEMMNILFISFPELHTRFYRYLGFVCAERTSKEMLCEDEEDRMIENAVESTAYLSFPPLDLVDEENQPVLSYIEGPSDMENGDSKMDTNFDSYLSARSISTYPYNEELKARLGNPICDYYCAKFYPNLAILGLADGCSWGPAPRKAAKNASTAFVRYLSKHQGKIHDVQTAGRLVVRAFSVAHSAIIHFHDSESDGSQVNSWEIGTTTILGGVLIPLKDTPLPFLQSPPTSPISPTTSSPPTSPPTSPLSTSPTSPPTSPLSPFPYSPTSPPCSPPSSPHLPLPPAPKKYAFVFGNIGDCKAFLYSSLLNQLSDITPEARVSDDATDCGGRLGPYIDGSQPDLRNFRVRFVPCSPGDLVILMSDGVHDNIDPEHLGLTPAEAGGATGEKDWEKVGWESGEQTRLLFRLKALQTILFRPSERHNLSKEDQRPENSWSHTQKEPDRGRNISPAEITNSLLQFCAELNQKSTKWMEENPSQKLPVNYMKFPGKMDHSSCMVCRVGGWETPTIATPPPPTETTTEEISEQ